jgi:hypothetical protein
VLALGLSGCLASDEPLITDDASVTPIAAGSNAVVGEADEKFAVTHVGPVTRFVDGGGPDDYRFAALDGGYYIAMGEFEDDYVYSLIHIEGPRFTAYMLDDSCDRLQRLLLRGGRMPADFGILSIEGETNSTCKFGGYEDLVRAFRALIEAGDLGEAEVYVRR